MVEIKANTPQMGANSQQATSQPRVKLPRWGWTVLALALTGCSSIGQEEFSCSGIPDGVRCMSARDVYAATNDGNVPRSVKAPGDAEALPLEPNSIRVSDNVVDTYVAPRLPDQPIPIRTPARVMRIWVSPWEDTNGDLIVTGFVYTEIEARKWVIGETGQQSVPMLKPLTKD